MTLLRFGPMADSAPVPRRFWAIIRWIADHYHWIFFLVALERLADGYYLTALVFFTIFVAALFVAPRWDTIADFAARLIPKLCRQSSQISISDGMYIGEINIDLNKVKEHYIEVAIRAFNGTGSVVSLDGIQGSIRYREISGTEELREMPPAAVRSDTSKTVLPGKEWFIILAQHIPEKMADEIAKLAVADSKKRLEFDLTKLDIQVVKAGQVGVPTRLPLWGGVSHEWGLPRLGRIIHFKANPITLGSGS